MVKLNKTLSIKYRLYDFGLFLLIFDTPKNILKQPKALQDFLLMSFLINTFLLHTCASLITELTANKSYK